VRHMLVSNIFYYLYLLYIIIYSYFMYTCTYTCNKFTCFYYTINTTCNTIINNKKIIAERVLHIRYLTFHVVTVMKTAYATAIIRSCHVLPDVPGVTEANQVAQHVFNITSEVEDIWNESREIVVMVLHRTSWATQLPQNCTTLMPYKQRFHPRPSGL
jgi:hypothetical protein